MFVRVKTRSNTEKKAVQIVKSIRQKDKVNQKVVYTVGYAFEDEEIEQLRDLREYIKADVEKKEKKFFFDKEYLAKEAIKARKRKEAQNKKEKYVDITKLREKERVTCGIHQVYGKVFKQLGFNNILTKRYEAASKLLFQTVMARLACPLNKKSSVAMLTHDLGVTINLDKVYRMMDKLDEEVIEKIQNTAYQGPINLLENKINVFFYDCATLYFEAFISDELKQNGYSKDGKFNQPRVLLALLVTTSGLPIGYEIFSGVTFEEHTLKPILEKIKSKYDLEKVVFVADSGLLCKENSTFLAQNNFHYILEAHIENFSNKFKKSFLDSISKRDPKEEKETLTEINHNGQRLIVCYSPKRARKDKHHREKAIEKLKKILAKKKQPKAFLNNAKYKKFIEFEGKTAVKINEEKVQKAAQWDGMCGVITNLKELEKENVVTHYRSLSQIKSCFGLQKHDLKIRPIFDWTPKQARAHIALCFITFCCQQHLSYVLKSANNSLSIEEIRKALVNVQLSVFEHPKTKCYYGIPSHISKEAKSIYKIIGIRYSSTPFMIAKEQKKYYVKTFGQKLN